MLVALSTCLQVQPVRADAESGLSSTLEQSPELAEDVCTPGGHVLASVISRRQERALGAGRGPGAAAVVLGGHCQEEV